MLRKTVFRLNKLAVAISLCIQPVMAFAFENIDDNDLRNVTGQDGISIQVQSDRVELDNVYWEDDGHRLNTNKVTVAANYADSVATSPAAKINSTVTINAGNNAGVPALDLQIQSNPWFAKVDKLQVNAQPTLGELVLMSGQSGTFGLTTTDGLFNSNGTAKIRLLVPDLQVYLTHNPLTSSVNRNQLAMQLRLDIEALGKMWISDTEGLRFSTGASGYVDFNAGNFAANPNLAGLNIAFFGRDNTAISANPYSQAGVRNLGRLAVAGRMVNTDLYLRGISGASTSDTTLTAGTIGSSGIAARFKGEMSSSFTFDLGEGGSNAYGLRFSGLKSFVDPAANASIDTGNIYVNLARKTGLTDTIGLPVNNNLLAATSLADAPTRANLATSANFNHAISDTSRDAVLLSIRGLALDSVPTQTRFVSSVDLTGANSVNSLPSQNWALGLLLNNVNANIALYGDTGATGERIGFGLGLTTSGLSADAKKTTSLLLLDQAGTGGRYMGLRNIDALMTAYGSLELRSDNIRMNLPRFMVALSTDYAIGRLPGRNGEAVNNFSTKKDSLFGLRLKLQGVNDSPTNYIALKTANTGTIGGNHFGFAADLDLTNSSVQLVDPTDSSRLGLDNISGRLQVTDGRVDLRGGSLSTDSTQIDPNNRNRAEIVANVVINPACSSTVANTCTTATGQAGALKVGAINMYAAPTATNFNPVGQTLGQMVITGGTLNSKFTLMPRN